MSHRATRAASPQGDLRLGARVLLGAPKRRLRPVAEEARHRGALVGELYPSVHALVALLVMLGVFLLDHRGALAAGLGDLLLVRLTVKNALLLGIFVIAWQRVFAVAGLSRPDPRRPWPKEARMVVLACSAGSLITFLFPAFSNSGRFGFDDAGLVWIGTIGAMLVTQGALRMAATPARVRVRRHVIIVGSGPRALRLFRELRAQGAHVIGFVDSTPHVAHEEIAHRMLGDLEQFEAVLMRHVVDEVLIALPVKSCYAQIQRAIEDCERAGVQAKHPVDVFQTTIARPRYEPSEPLPAVTMSVVRDDGRIALKRGLDVSVAAAGLLLLSPLMLAIALAVRLTSPGPTLFAQERFGFRKRRFHMLKFRTMVANAEQLQPLVESRNEASGPVFKIRDDPRTTPIGRFLRRTSLDELPQLVNVLRGEMSLVGPRPLPTRDVKGFDRSWLMRRFSVPPGITGLWQVSGRSNLNFEEWMTLDLEYVDNWSLQLDLRILLRTIPVVLRGTGAS